ncbi:MAG: glutathione peroxidase [Chitinophagales bacterium]|nr:glutathione peroxidase [Chitinophagales bacterium]
MTTVSSIHAFTFPSIEGGTIDFSDFKGKKIIVVNTASDCEYTPQFRQLEELYKQFPDKLMVVGFPSNNFGGQEPGDNKQIKSFCQYRYGVTFPLASKSDVIGEHANPVFKWLTDQEMDSGKNKTITWNFQKFLLDEEGTLIEVFSPSHDPLNEHMLTLINA